MHSNNCTLPSRCGKLGRADVSGFTSVARSHWCWTWASLLPHLSNERFWSLPPFLFRNMIFMAIPLFISIFPRCTAAPCPICPALNPDHFFLGSLYAVLFTGEGENTSVITLHLRYLLVSPCIQASIHFWRSFCLTIFCGVCIIHHAMSYAVMFVSRLREDVAREQLSVGRRLLDYNGGWNSFHVVYDANFSYYFCSLNYNTEMHVLQPLFPAIFCVHISSRWLTRHRRKNLTIDHVFQQKIQFGP